MKKIRYLICAVLVIVTATLLASAASAAKVKTIWNTETRWPDHGQPETGLVLTSKTEIEDDGTEGKRYGLSTVEGAEFLPMSYTGIKYEGNYITCYFVSWYVTDQKFYAFDTNGNLIFSDTCKGWLGDFEFDYYSDIDCYVYSRTFNGSITKSILFNSKLEPLFEAKAIVDVGDGYFYMYSESSKGFSQGDYCQGVELYKVYNSEVHKIAAYDKFDYLENGAFAVAEEENKWGVINGNGELIVPMQYETIVSLRENYVIIGRFVPNSEESNVPWDRFGYASNRRLGMVDYAGHEMLPTIYYSIGQVKADGTVDVKVWNGEYHTESGYFTDVKVKTLVTKTIDLKENKYYNLANNIKCVEPFQDVAEDAYYADAVRWANENGVTQGTTQTTFSPSANVTRGQAVTFLWRAMGSPEPKISERPFTDVSEGDFFYKPVLWAYENGITTGTSADKYSPHAPCTNSQIITFIWRTLGEPAASKLGRISRSYEDGEWYKSAVAWAEEKSLLLSAYSFNTDDECLRGDMVTYIYRALG